MKHELFAADAKLVEALCEVSHRVSCSEGGTLFIQGGVCNGLYTLETRQHYQESSSSSIARYQQQLRSTLAKVRSHRRVPGGSPGTRYGILRGVDSAHGRRRTSCRSQRS